VVGGQTLDFVADSTLVLPNGVDHQIFHTGSEAIELVQLSR